MPPGLLSVSLRPLAVPYAKYFSLGFENPLDGLHELGFRDRPYNLLLGFPILEEDEIGDAADVVACRCLGILVDIHPGQSLQIIPRRSSGGWSS